MWLLLVGRCGVQSDCGAAPPDRLLINNAAVYEPFLVAEATDEQILKIIATNLTGPILCVRAAIPLMHAGGHIINRAASPSELRSRT